MKKSNIENLIIQSPYSLNKDEKEELFLSSLKESFLHHYNNNRLFKNFCLNSSFTVDNIDTDLSKFPYFPVNLFKRKNLISIEESEIKGILNSSATSGIPSSITIDKLTSKRQSIVSSRVMSDYLGNHRRHFMILDIDPLKSRSIEISARAAASRGFLNLASSYDYLLEEGPEGLTLNLESFISSVEYRIERNEELCFFGFTYVLYHSVIKNLLANDITFKLPAGSKIAHIGGWKKLESQRVSKAKFLKDVSKVFGISKENIFDFYGFTEQMGLVYVSQGDSPKVIPAYSHLIVRDFQTLEPVPDGEEGLLQFITPIPHSYPGVSILTEDVGRIIERGTDEYGRHGVQFEIIGRAKDAEVRGCGDIMSNYIA